MPYRDLAQLHYPHAGVSWFSPRPRQLCGLKECFTELQHTRFECLRERTLSLLEVLINIHF